jgi:hypothetical protein
MKNRKKITPVLRLRRESVRVIGRENLRLIVAGIDDEATDMSPTSDGFRATCTTSDNFPCAA